VGSGIIALYASIAYGDKMSGIIAPSIVTYDYKVGELNNSFINVSFPFKVQIEGIWFTADRRMLNGTYDGDLFEDAGRTLILSAQKSKSPRIVLSNIDEPTDWAPFFGYDEPETQTDVVYGSDEFKPTIWVGLPEDAPAGMFKDATTQYINNNIDNSPAFRSSTGFAPALDDDHNPYWGNNGWSSGQFAANKYKTNMAILNPDEIISLFVYSNDGDWTDYDGEATVTVHVAYSGVSETVEKEDPKTPWSAWWND
jgi:hypothetical protein